MALTAVEDRARWETTKLIAVVAGLVAIVVSAIVVLAVQRDGEATSQATPTTAVPRPTTPERLTADNVEWLELFDATRLPTSSAGPHKVEGNRALGFDRSEAGAVLAAVHIGTRAAARSGPEVFEATLQEQVVGADRGKWLENIRTSYAELRQSNAVAADGHVLYPPAEEEAIRRSWLTAYRVDAFSPDAASVQLLLRSVPPGQTGVIYVNLGFSVRWVDGDWRLVAPLNGDSSSAASRVTTVPSDYVSLGDPGAR